MNPSFAYRASAVSGCTPVGLVVLLYEQLIEDLRAAVAAMLARDVEKRSHELDHALRVVGQLQGTLNMEAGGEAAHNLDRFYNLLRASLLQAQLQVSPEVLGRQIAHLLDLREAWIAVERTTAGNGPPPSSHPSVPKTEGNRITDWTG